MTMRKQAGQTKKIQLTAAHKTTRRSAGTKLQQKRKSTPSKSKKAGSANTSLISDLTAIYSAQVLTTRYKSWALIL